MGNKVSLEEQMINLRIVSKQMQRSSMKCKKSEKAAIEKLKKVCCRCRCRWSARETPHGVQIPGCTGSCCAILFESLTDHALLCSALL